MNTFTAVTLLMEAAWQMHTDAPFEGARIIRPMGHMTELPLFDAAASRAARDAGMLRAATNKREALTYAHEVAERLARKNGVVNADDVARVLASEGREGLGNAAGSLFTDRKKWVFTGRLVKSERVNAHSNLLREWRLK